MSGTIEDKRQRIEKTKELASIVRTMKALAASKIGQYEDSTRAMEAYYRTIMLGLSVCLSEQKTSISPDKKKNAKHQTIGAVVIGTDLGLVGQFNEDLSQFVIETLAGFPGDKKIWAVGERVYSSLLEADLDVVKMYRVPNSTKAITPLVGQLLLESQTASLYIFQNRLKTGATYKQEVQRMLPLDEKWLLKIGAQQWITDRLPEVLPEYEQTLSALIREYLFVALFKACVESLTAENTTRLRAMQRAEKNIGELLKDLQQSYHRVRQNAIDEELFDIIAGFEALQIKKE